MMGAAATCTAQPTGRGPHLAESCVSGCLAAAPTVTRAPSSGSRARSSPLSNLKWTLPGYVRSAASISSAARPERSTANALRKALLVSIAASLLVPSGPNVQVPRSEVAVAPALGSWRPSSSKATLALQQVARAAC